MSLVVAYYLIVYTAEAGRTSPAAVPLQRGPHTGAVSELYGIIRLGGLKQQVHMSFCSNAETSRVTPPNMGFRCAHTLSLAPPASPFPVSTCCCLSHLLKLRLLSEADAGVTARPPNELTPTGVTNAPTSFATSIAATEKSERRTQAAILPNERHQQVAARKKDLHNATQNSSASNPAVKSEEGRRSEAPIP